jgi:ABC-type Zn uptake system ZnuABC Zn-binding protein ZnuA
MRITSLFTLFAIFHLATPIGRAEVLLRVLASTTLIADVTREIAGPVAEVRALAGAQSDPHAFDPSPAQIRAAREADLLFVNGAGLETGLLKALQDAQAGNAVHEVSAGIAFRTGGATCVHDHSEDGEHHHHHHDHEHGPADPHVWFDPLLVKTWATNITAALVERRPAARAELEARRDAYTARLDALHAWILERVQTLPAERRQLVSDHAFLGYFADRYQFAYTHSLLPGASTLAQPSARALGQAVQAMRQARVPALFVEAGASDRLARAIAREAGATVVPLHTCSLGGPGSGAETYLDFMRANVNAILRGLGHGQP